MSAIEIFDVIRHIFEFFFYLVTGPLVTFFAVKKITQKKDTKTQILELQRKIFELEKRTSAQAQEVTLLQGESKD